MTGPHASQVRAQYHQLARAEAWAAQNSQPILSFSFCHLFSLYFPSSLALRFWRPWWGPAKAFPELGLEALGLLLSNLRILSQEITVVISH